MKVPGSVDHGGWRKEFNPQVEKIGKSALERRVDPNGEALVWCRKCHVMLGAVSSRSFSEMRGRVLV